MCVRLNRTGCQYFLPAWPPQSSPWVRVIKWCSSRQHPGWKAVHICPQGKGWMGGVTFCRFCSYSCGCTVIISPLLLNSMILSYISRARGQEILQFINRSLLCKGDYHMAYALTSLSGLKDIFFSGFSVFPRLCLCPVMLCWVCSGSQLQPLSTHIVWPALCLHITLPLCFTVPMENGTKRD